MELQGEARAELLADLHALATYLEDHPEIPIEPWDARISHSLGTNTADDAAGLAQVQRIADALGVELTVSGGTHHQATLKVGGASYQATYIDRQHMADYDEYMA